MLVLKDDQMVIVDVEEAMRGPYNTSIFPGRYIRNNKGYWYAMDIEWGHVRRIRYAGQVEKLESLI